MQKRFDEYLAKVILEYVFPEKFTDLQIVDKPDLRCGSDIGIEVTNCTIEGVNAAFNIARNTMCGEYSDIQRSINDIARIGKKKNANCAASFEFNEHSSVLEVGFNGLYVDYMNDAIMDDVFKCPTKDFIRAVENKINKLNKYEEMQRYELFVISSTSSIVQGHYRKVLNYLNKINCNKRKYSTIYFFTNEYELLTFDLKNNTVKNVPLYDKYSEMCQQVYDKFQGKFK